MEGLPEGLLGALHGFHFPRPPSRPDVLARRCQAIAAEGNTGDLPSDHDRHDRARRTPIPGYCDPALVCKAAGSDPSVHHDLTGGRSEDRSGPGVRTLRCSAKESARLKGGVL
jgi:hypothetical protein